MSLRVWARLPQGTVPLGRGQALVVTGYVKHPLHRVAKLWLLAAGQRRAMTVIPAAPDDDGAHKVRMRGRVLLERCDPEVPVTIEVQLADGTRVRRKVGTVRTARSSESEAVEVVWPSLGPRVAICLATYEPHPFWLAQQLKSIKKQTHPNWICLIHDDASGSPFTDAIHELVAGDSRFVFLEHRDNVGAYRNFERALATAPRDAEFIAFCDQDDIWDPDKLEVLLNEMADPTVSLAYSDMRLVDDEGKRLANSFWNRRVNKHDDLIALTTVNTVTGAASLMRTELIRDHVLPFPPAEAAFHDHWTAVMALATGRIAFVDRPLYSYRQHVSAVTGHQDQDAAHWLPSLPRIIAGSRRQQLLSRNERWHLDRVGRENLPRLATFAEVASARGGKAISRSDRWWLAQMSRADRRTLPTIALAFRSRRYSSTNLREERVLATSALWRQLNRRSPPLGPVPKRGRGPRQTDSSS